MKWAIGLMVILAGCVGTVGADAGELNLITPGSWHVSGADQIMVYLHNEAATAATYELTLTMANGTDTPQGWGLEIAQPTGTLQPAGSKEAGSRGYDYTDWAFTTITVADVPVGDYDLVLKALGQEVPIALHATAPANVTGPGDAIEVQYRGTFTNTGIEFDAGEFPTTLGSGQTVPGFDNGLMGLELGETAKLVLPAAYAYGYDIPDGNRLSKFNGQSLTFEVTILSIS